MPIQNELIQIANDICFNNGHNGFDAVEIDIQRDVFTNFINSFTYVFTTNYDYLLDDVLNNEVFHLHGGFNFTETHHECGAIDITRDKNVRKVDNPFLAWGINGDEKLKSIQGGITYPITYPKRYGTSIIDDYFKILSNGQFKEIHIWGYSGENDSHINDNIKKNAHIEMIYFYCNPNEINNNQYRQHIADLFKSQDKNLILKPWNIIWTKAGIS